jgi:hypothetical protein
MLWLRCSQACDEFGNARAAGGDAFAASIQGLGADAVKITDRGDGMHAAQYTVPSEGVFSLSVTGADGRHVRGSPATLTVFRWGARAAHTPALCAYICTLGMLYRDHEDSDIFPAYQTADMQQELPCWLNPSHEREGGELRARRHPEDSKSFQLHASWGRLAQ